MFIHKGYTATPQIDTDCNIIRGRIRGINDVITFEGKTVNAAYLDFQESVDDYLAWCEELGEPTNKHFSGNLLCRTTPDMHQRFHLAANLLGKSINALMNEAISKELDRVIGDQEK